MTTPEQDIFTRLLVRLERLHASMADDLALLGDVPDDLATFEALPPARRSGSRAVLKSFEQIEDQLARAFRLIPRLLAENTDQWFARDYADYMEKIGILDDAARWSVIVRLRNDLVHDYPLDADVQYARFRAAVAALDDLSAAYRKLLLFAQTELRDHLP